MDVTNDTANQRFFVRLPEGMGQLIYKQVAPRLLELIHTEVNPSLRGRGVGEALAQSAIAYAREHDMRIIPTCPYVQRWLTKHPEYADLVAAPSDAD